VLFFGIMQKRNKNCGAEEVTGNYIVEQSCLQARYVPKASNTHTEYVIFIPLPWQQTFRGRAVMLR